MTACILCGSELWADGSPNLWTEARAKEAEQEAADQASELATLRRRVEEMEEALRAIAGQSVYEDDDYRIQLQDTIDAAREVATAALASPLPPVRNEG